MDETLPPGFTLLQVVPRLEGGGVERATLDLSRAVVRAGRRSIVASAGGRLEPELAEGGGELARLPMQAKDPAGIWRNAARLADLVRRERVSLIHVRSRAPAFSALWAGRRTGIPVVATYHGIYGGGGPLKRWYNGVMTSGDLVIANSAFTRDHLSAEHNPDPARVLVVPEGIDTAAFDPAAVSAERMAGARARLGLEANGPPTLLMAARLTAWKGQLTAIEALARVTASPPPVLVLAGGTENEAYARSLSRRAAELGLAERVRVPGRIDDIPAALAVADLVLAPSLKAESFGRGVVEAMAMARPTIASAVGAHLETVAPGETGWLAPPGDAAAWARAIDDALACPPDQRANLGRRARARAVAIYDLDPMTRATFAAYRSVLGRR